MTRDAQNEEEQHWLFHIMPWMVQRGGWKKEVEWGIAAQHYPTDDWRGADRNLPLLRQIKRGDWLVAGNQFRFAGYGKADSAFYQGGRSLQLGSRYSGDRPSMDSGGEDS